MKKLLLLLIVIPLTFFGQSNNNLPIIDLGIDIAEDEDNTRWDVIPIFKPIGWNKEGKFAYQITKCDDMCGCCTDYICIRSIITDRVIEEIHLGEQSQKSDSYKDSINEIKEINLLLSKYRIEKTGFGELIHSNKINQYDIVFKQNEITNYDEYNYEYTILEYTILVGNNKIGFKKISEGIVEEPLGDLNYIGYFKYPFENRILILFTSATWGEEETNWHTLHFVGCSLDRRTF